MRGERESYQSGRVSIACCSRQSGDFKDKSELGNDDHLIVAFSKLLELSGRFPVRLLFPREASTTT